VDIERGHVTSQLLLLGALFSILAFISDGSWGLLAGTARTWLASDEKRLENLRSVGGIVMITLGLLVIASALRDLIST
jgi:threonine/homoserine/homoserine lactone efflux protein